MKLSLEDVRHVAKLARLTLTAEEETLYAGQLSAILSAVDELKAVDTDKVQATSHASLSDALLREDQAVDSLPVEKGLSNAPAKSGSHFSVPKILE